MAEATLLELVLQRLSEVSTGLDSCDLADTLGHDHQAVVGAVKSLQSFGEVRAPRLLYLHLAYCPSTG